MSTKGVWFAAMGMGRFEYLGDDGQWQEFERAQQEELRALHELRPIPRRFFFSTSSNVYVMDNFHLVDNALSRDSTRLMGCGTVVIWVEVVRCAVRVVE